MSTAAPTSSDCDPGALVQREPRVPVPCEDDRSITIALDRIHITNLVVPGIIGINPDERINQQDVRVNATLWADTSPAGVSDDINDAVNYRTITKALIAHIEGGKPMLVERLVQELADICLADPRVESVEMTVEKPGALRHAESVGITIRRQRLGKSTGLLGKAAELLGLRTARGGAEDDGGDTGPGFLG